MWFRSSLVRNGCGTSFNVENGLASPHRCMHSVLPAQRAHRPLIVRLEYELSFDHDHCDDDVVLFAEAWPRKRASYMFTCRRSSLAVYLATKVTRNVILSVNSFDVNYKKFHSNPRLFTFSRPNDDQCADSREIFVFIMKYGSCQSIDSYTNKLACSWKLIWIEIIL